MRRALVVFLAVAFLLIAPRANAATVTINISNGHPDKDPASIVAGDNVRWHNKDATDHTVILEDGRSVPVPANGTSDGVQVDDSESYIIDKESNGVFSIVASEPTTTTTTTEATTTTTTKATTTTASSTTTTSTSTTSTSTSTTTTLVSSASGPITASNTGGGGGSSALPLILGALVVVAALAGLAYWLWLRSGEPYDEGPDWTQEPPPTTQGPQI